MNKVKGRDGWIVDCWSNYERELIQSNHSWGIPLAGCWNELGSISHKNTSVQSDSKGNWEVWMHLKTSKPEMEGIRRSQLWFFRSGFSQSFSYRFRWCFRRCFIPWNTIWNISWNWVWNSGWNTRLKHYMKHLHSETCMKHKKSPETYVSDYVSCAWNSILIL